jgi:glycosyltransferase involved in cell wall biosynthesis
MNILWLVEIDPEYGMRHGATLRYTNFSRGLIAKGHRVYFGLQSLTEFDGGARTRYLDELKVQNCCTDWFEFDSIQIPHRKAKWSRLFIHPGVRCRVLSKHYGPIERQFLELTSRLSITVCIVSDRKNLCLVPTISRRIATIIDWGDSFVLVILRELRLLLKAGQLSKLAPRLGDLARNVIEEMFYGRYPGANMAISAGDRRMLDRLNRRPHVNCVITNGVAQANEQHTSSNKIAKRLIFSGSMNFPPNYAGALWFLEKVMPALLRQDPTIHFVIAGQKPIPELLAKAGQNVEVVGLVSDLRAEIAKSQLYVAPLISGTGFRNKVVEAIDCGTYVIGTSMALEFLPKNCRDQLLSADAPEKFAKQIEMFLSNPSAYDHKLEEARRVVQKEYSWERKVNELEKLCFQVSKSSSEAWHA